MAIICLQLGRCVEILPQLPACVAYVVDLAEAVLHHEATTGYNFLDGISVVHTDQQHQGTHFPLNVFILLFSL